MAGAAEHALVTGGAGFIGGHLVEALVVAGKAVTVLDDLSAGRKAALATVERRIRFVEGDAADGAVLDRVMPGISEVWHLAADPEVRSGLKDPVRQMMASVAQTQSVLESMRRHKVRRMRFTSSSTVYGRATVVPTPESFGPLAPTSVYGAAKLAGEGLIASYAASFGIDAVAFRFANVVGPRSSHGVAFDFVEKLRRDPHTLEVLGDGKQEKSYVSVADTVAGMMHGAGRASGGFAIYNLGSRDTIPVTRIAALVSDAMGVRPKLKFTGAAPGGGGWQGDVARMALDSSKLEALGWRPRHGSEEAMRIAIADLVASGKRHIAT